MFVALENRIWVIGELSEAPLAWIQKDDFPYLWPKYAILFLAACMFAKTGWLAYKTERIHHKK